MFLCLLSRSIPEYISPCTCTYSLLLICAIYASYFPGLESLALRPNSPLPLVHLVALELAKLLITSISLCPTLKDSLLIYLNRVWHSHNNGQHMQMLRSLDWCHLWQSHATTLHQPGWWSWPASCAWQARHSPLLALMTHSHGGWHVESVEGTLISDVLGSAPLDMLSDLGTLAMVSIQRFFCFCFCFCFFQKRKECTAMNTMHSSCWPPDTAPCTSTCTVMLSYIAALSEGQSDLGDTCPLTKKHLLPDMFSTAQSMPWPFHAVPHWGMHCLWSRLPSHGRCHMGEHPL